MAKAHAHHAMLLAMRLERCKVAGCERPVVVTRNHTGIHKVRECIGHLGSQPASESESTPETQVANIRALLAMPTRNGG